MVGWLLRLIAWINYFVVWLSLVVLWLKGEPMQLLPIPAFTAIFFMLASIAHKPEKK